MNKAISTSISLVVLTLTFGVATASAQEAASFSLDQVMEKLTSAGAH